VPPRAPKSIVGLELRFHGAGGGSGGAGGPGDDDLPIGDHIYAELSDGGAEVLPAPPPPLHFTNGADGGGEGEDGGAQRAGAEDDPGCCSACTVM